MPAGSVHRLAVSLTPASLDADSRAFRIASSLAEAGFRSIVVEGRPSTERFWDERIEVRSAGMPDSGPPAPGLSRRHPMVGALRAGAFGGIGEFALYLGFRGHDWWRHCRLMRPLLPQADLYYLHSFELHRVVAEPAARCGAAIFYDAHDFYRGITPGALQPSFDRKRLRPFLDALEERLVRGADAVVAVSDGVARLMRDAFGRSPAVIRNCHDARLDRPVPAGLRRVLGLGPGDRLAVVAGNAKPGMAIAAAADALHLLGGRFHLAFVGRAYEEAAAGLRDHPATARIHFPGARAPSEIVPFIASADVGLVIYEPYSENYRAALPNGFFQAVAAGLPLVYGLLPEIEAAVGGRAIGVPLPHLEAPALAAAIRQCAESAPALRRAAGDFARELSWEKESSRLRALLQAHFDRRAADTAAQ